MRLAFLILTCFKATSVPAQCPLQTTLKDPLPNSLFVENEISSLPNGQENIFWLVGIRCTWTALFLKILCVWLRDIPIKSSYEDTFRNISLHAILNLDTLHTCIIHSYATAVVSFLKWKSVLVPHIKGTSSHMTGRYYSNDQLVAIVTPHSRGLLNNKMLCFLSYTFRSRQRKMVLEFLTELMVITML